MAKDEKYFGKSLEELQAMSIEEFALVAGARARRSLRRGVDKKLLKKVEKALAEKAKGKEPKPIRTQLRSAIIIPRMIGVRIAVHRGNTFEIVEISPKMLGHCLGEMAMTRKRLSHGKAGIGATKSSTAITARG